LRKSLFGLLSLILCIEKDSYIIIHFIKHYDDEINYFTIYYTKDVTNSLYYLYANNYVDYAKPFTIHSGNIQPYKLDSFLEFVISRVVHHIFPKNFPKYSLFYQKNDEKVVMEAVGYIKENAQKEPENPVSLAGAENVYAAAFYLGLEVRTPVYELNGNLYVDDFSHPLHDIDKDEKCLIDEYRDHKISFSEDGTLFPQSFMNNSCAKWFGGEKCDTKKLQNAYEAIINTSIIELQNIVDNAVDIFAVVENDYQQASEDLKSVLIGNIDIIKDLVQSGG
jgi:hypothetical protein